MESPWVYQPPQGQPDAQESHKKNFTTILYTFGMVFFFLLRLGIFSLTVLLFACYLLGFCFLDFFFFEGLFLGQQPN